MRSLAIWATVVAQCILSSCLLWAVAGSAGTWMEGCTIAARYASRSETFHSRVVKMNAMEINKRTATAMNDNTK
jgi:hypothetical protein